MYNDILYDNKLTDKQKLLYCCVSSMCASEGYCYASNSTIGKKLNAEPNTISKYMSVLEKHGLITVEITNGFDRKVFLRGVVPQSYGDMTPVQEYNIIYNITELESLFNEDEKQKYKNELYIIGKGIELGLDFKLDKQKILKLCVRVKDMLSEFIPRKEDGKIDWNLAKSYTNARYDYWENPPKGKKKPTNFKTSLRNNIEMRTKPKQRKK